MTCCALDFRMLSFGFKFVECGCASRAHPETTLMLTKLHTESVRECTQILWEAHGRLGITSLYLCWVRGIGIIVLSGSAINYRHYVNVILALAWFVTVVNIRPICTTLTCHAHYTQACTWMEHPG